MDVMHHQLFIPLFLAWKQASIREWDFAPWELLETTPGSTSMLGVFREVLHPSPPISFIGESHTGLCLRRGNSFFIVCRNSEAIPTQDPDLAASHLWIQTWGLPVSGGVPFCYAFVLWSEAIVHHTYLWWVSCKIPILNLKHLWRIELWTTVCKHSI